MPIKQRTHIKEPFKHYYFFFNRSENMMEKLEKAIETASYDENKKSDTMFKRMRNSGTL